MCQQCFFSGQTSKSHKLTHPMQEYCSMVCVFRLLYVLFTYLFFKNMFLLFTFFFSFSNSEIWNSRCLIDSLLLLSLYLHKDVVFQTVSTMPRSSMSFQKSQLQYVVDHRNQQPLLWHCSLGHLTCKIISDMTYNVFGGTLNPTLLLLPTTSLLSIVQLCQQVRYANWSHVWPYWTSRCKPWWRMVKDLSPVSNTGVTAWVHGPSSRPVNSGSGNRALRLHRPVWM